MDMHLPTFPAAPRQHNPARSQDIRGVGRYAFVVVATLVGCGLWVSMGPANDDLSPVADYVASVQRGDGVGACADAQRAAKFHNGRDPALQQGWQAIADMVCTAQVPGNASVAVGTVH